MQARGATAATDRGEISRRHILNTAALAFAENGYNGVSLNDIVRDTGLTKGAFYFHFPSKEALALEVFGTKQLDWQAAIAERLAPYERAIDRLNAMLDCGCEMYETDASARVVGRLCVELSRERKLAPRLTVYLKTWFEMVTDLIRAAQDEGDARTDLDPRLSAETIVSAFIGVEQVSDALTELGDFRARIEKLRTFVMAALRPCP
ncbi:MAG TPA: TetR/AcrR family transcriptional regulator [Actinomycetota bacterium]|nr:TetR/AcrR family transcriptional regulator [Actinomycetota bacterium]